MIPCNDFTSPEQRFFYSHMGPIEHHTTFNTEGLPSVEILDGRSARSIVHTEVGEEISYEAGSSYRTDIPQGATIGHIALLDSVARMLPKTNEEILEIYKEAPVKYTPTEQDTLIIKANSSAYVYDPSEQGKKLHDTQGLFLHPAREPLPTLVHKSGVYKDDGMFQVVGIIKEDNTLLGWDSERGNRTVDWCIAYEKAINGLELYLLQDDIGTGGSLTGHVSKGSLARFYLEEFRNRTGDDLLPDGEPLDKAKSFPTLTADEVERLYFLTESARTVKC